MGSSLGDLKAFPKDVRGLIEICLIERKSVTQAEAAQILGIN